MDTNGLEKKLEGIKGRITANRNNTVEAEKRKRTATEKLEDYQSRYEKAREERQSLLASGKDVKKINELIKSMQADKELAEDEVIGLDKMLVDLSDEFQGLGKEEEQAEIDILESKLIPLVPVYNEAAAKLAAIVENIWDLLRALNVPHRTPNPIISVVGWDENALTIIPKLFRADEQLPRTNTEDAVHFWYRYYIDKKRREREAQATSPDLDKYDADIAQL